MSLKRIASLVLVAVLAVTAVGLAPATARAQDVARTPAQICADATADIAEPETREFGQAEDVLQDGVDYAAVLCTAQGPIYVDLYEDLAPITVNNFVFLAQQGYYNNTTFHRVIPGFMAQGGDPTGTGAGGPGYTFEDETGNDLVFDTFGVLAMANAGADTNGSQFFITYSPTDWLNGAHTIFGKVLQGLDVAELLTPRDPDQAPAYEGDALETVVIVEDPASVEVVPDGPPSPEHFQALLDSAVVGMTDIFDVVEAATGPLDADGVAALWAGSAGDEAVAAVRSYLDEHGFQGTASVGFRLAECYDDPETLPIWYLGYEVTDYGTADAAQTVVQDAARADQLVDLGVYERHSAATTEGGQVFTRPATDICGETGRFYRVEVADGRYVAAVEVVLDSRVLGEDTDPTAVQFAELVASDLASAFSGVFMRGNAAVAAE